MFTRRTLLTGGIAAAGLGAIASCTPPASGGDAGEDATSLTVYSNSLDDPRTAWLREKSTEAGFQLQYVSLGGGDLYNRLLAEKANPLADAIFGLNNVYFEQLKGEDVLEPYTPAWADKVDAGVGDDETFFPIVREPIMLVYSDKAYPGGKGAPTDWPDLWTKPEFEKKYEVPAELGGATTQMVISGILVRYQEEGGELGISDEGWDAITQYFQKGSPAVEGTDMYARMVSGEVTAGQMWLAGKTAREEEYGITTSAASPSIGVPMVYQHTAIAKGAKNLEAAKKFVDWFGSAEVQAGWSKEFATAPTNKDGLADGNTEAIEFTDSFTSQDIDWTFVAENLNAWIEKIELDVLG